MKTNKPILHLNLHRKWFDIIGDPKNEEYRAISEYFKKIFSVGFIKVKGVWHKASDVTICFSNGYAKNRPQKFFDVKSVTIGGGREEWGAEKETIYFVITLDTKQL